MAAVVFPADSDRARFSVAVAGSSSASTRAGERPRLGAGSASARGSGDNARLLDDSAVLDAETERERAVGSLFPLVDSSAAVVFLVVLVVLGAFSAFGAFSVLIFSAFSAAVFFGAAVLRAGCSTVLEDFMNMPVFGSRGGSVLVVAALLMVGFGKNGRIHGMTNFLSDNGCYSALKLW